MDPPSPDSSSSGSDASVNRRDPPVPPPPPPRPPPPPPPRPPPPPPPRLPPPQPLHDVPISFETTSEQFKRVVLQHTKWKMPPYSDGPPPQASKFRRVDDTGRSLILHNFLGTASASGSIRQPSYPPPLPPLPRSPPEPPSHPFNMLMEHNSPSASANMSLKYFRQPWYTRYYYSPSPTPTKNSFVTRDFLGNMERQMGAGASSSRPAPPPKSPSTSTESDACKK